MVQKRYMDIMGVLHTPIIWGQLVKESLQVHPQQLRKYTEHMWRVRYIVSKPCLVTCSDCAGPRGGPEPRMAIMGSLSPEDFKTFFQGSHCWGPARSPGNPANSLLQLAGPDSELMRLQQQVSFKLINSIH
jgi:hypothetical protein